MMLDNLDIERKKRSFILVDDETCDKKVICELSDEEIKLAILELTARNNCLTELSYDEFNRLKEIFQWVKGE